MKNHKQVVKLCGVCGNERVYTVYHRIYNYFKKCFAKNSARYYQTKRDKIITKSKLKSTKQKISNTTNKKTQQTKDLNNKMEELTQTLETLMLKNDRIKGICKCQSLTTYIVKFVTDSIQKNNGINISILVDICIEKSKVIGQRFFHKEH